MADNIKQYLKSHRVVKMSAYTSPKIEENAKGGYVKYGANDEYYQHLIDLFHTSPTNNASIQGISDLIYGDGVEVNMDETDVNDWAMYQSLFNADCIRKVCHDLKLFGHASFQCTFEGGKLIAVSHIARDTIRPGILNEEGEIDCFYFCSDWSKVGKRGFELQKIPAYGYQKDGDQFAILSIDSYSAGSVYFTPVDYQGGLQYAELEGEISNYHLNAIHNGLAPGLLVNFNNGIPTEEEQDQIERDINSKWGGSSNAGRTIIAFNDDKEKSATIEPVQLSDAHNLYEFLSSECMRKIMVSHRITSPMLLGIKDNTGLGNNADELEKASILFNNSVIKPFQDLIIEGMQYILRDQDLKVDISFKTSNPFKSSEEDAGDVEVSYTGIQISSALDVITRTKTGELTESQAISILISMLGLSKEVAEGMFAKDEVQLSKASPRLEDEDAQFWVDYLSDKGETIDEDEWELVHEEVVEDYDQPDSDFFTLFKRFADPDAKSEDDSGIYRVRYRYDPPEETRNDKGEVVSRIFCRTMVRNAKANVIYRRDDIDKMSDAGINGEWAKKGQSKYDIWKFKGGGGCYHRWVRMVFKRKTDKGKVRPLDESEKGTTDRNLDKNYNEIEPATAKSSGVPKAKLEPSGYDDAITKPKDMKDRGFVTKKG